MTFGENLKTLRTSRGLSQKELAENLGFSFQNVSKWERNQSLPDVETLLEMADFFGTTTDALLGHAPEQKFATLQINENEVTIYRTYPKEEETIRWSVLFAIDAENKITGIVSRPFGHPYKKGYIRKNYDPIEETSTLLYDFSCRKRNGIVPDIKKVRIPKDGYLISVSNSDFALKKITEFIIPEEHLTYLDPHNCPQYYNSRNGLYLFSDILKYNELDHITVEYTAGRLLFQKPIDSVDPMSVNIETLAKIVRIELEKEHNKQIEELKNQIDDLADMVYDNESNISELEDQISTLEARITDLEGQLSETN